MFDAVEKNILCALAAPPPPAEAVIRACDKLAGMLCEDVHLPLLMRLGMSREMVDILLTARSKTGGIGLHNVHERITLTYGKNSGLTIESEQDAGTLITIRQPVHLEVESH